MAIYRGNGGASDITSGITLNEVTALTIRAEDASDAAAVSAAAAAASEAGVEADAIAAATSATQAASSATESITQAQNATTSATNAATSATQAANSATSSATSASASATSASNSASSATASATSATNSANSATASANSATSAANQATNAATSAAASATSASNSANSATAAATSASAASTSASDAATSASAAAASYDSFDDRYLGAKASQPTVDNDGNALLTGALYWNSTSNNLFIWTGSAWNAAALDVGTALFDADIGVTVQAYDATLLNDADIGVTVQAYDATLLNDADIGVTVQAYDATLLNDADIGVTVQAYDANNTTATNTQTLTNKTITGTVETKVAMGANDIDLSAGNYFTKTISGATTLTVSNVASSGSVSAFVLELTNGGAYTITFFAGVTWAAATAPTLTEAGVDTLAFFTTDGGTTWRGFVLGLNMGS